MTFSERLQGRHPDRVLTPVRIRSIQTPGRYGDGNGLYLIVDPSGNKRWMLRTTVQGRRRDIGLGGVRLVSLAEAREKAAALRKIARDGGDPVAEVRGSRTRVPTFEEAARTVHAEHSVSWKNPKRRAQWLNTLKTYVFPIFGDLAVDQLGTPEVLRALSPIWITKPETARRVRQRIGTVLDWSKAAGHRTGDNPVREIAAVLPRQPERRGHYAALPYDEVPAFVEALRKANGSETTRLGLEFLILTAARTSEVIGARWPEVDLEAEIWTIPPERIKAGREHRIPLSPRCLEILKRARELGGELYVFPGRKPDGPLSNMSFLGLIRRIGKKITAHGFRSSFRDWAAERTNFSREVSEKALAHVVTDKVEAAYRRGDLFDKRRRLMAAWSKFATSGQQSRVVVPLRRNTM